MDNSVETVLSICHLSDSIFYFRTTRKRTLEFKNGQFLLLGLEINGKVLWRAYSIVSPNYENYLEFLSIKVSDGALTSRLQHLSIGDTVFVGGRPSGTLIVDNLVGGRNLYLLATGTGLAPFMSIIRDPEVYSRFEKVILVHCVKLIVELAYRDYLLNVLPGDERVGEAVKRSLLYYPIVTREQFHTKGRIQDLLASGQISADLSLPSLDSKNDRSMICGNPHMVVAVAEWFRQSGFIEASHGKPGEFVLERAFVDKSDLSS